MVPEAGREFGMQRQRYERREDTDSGRLTVRAKEE